MSKSENLIKGKLGEDLAIEYLRDHLYKIKAKNYKCKLGEIDIIAEKDNIIVFIEVKSRSSDAFGMPRDAVNYYKQRKIRHVAEVYIKQNRLYDKSCQFDVIEILNGEIDHIENCF